MLDLVDVSFKHQSEFDGSPNNSRLMLRDNRLHNARHDLNVQHGGLVPAGWGMAARMTSLRVGKSAHNDACKSSAGLARVAPISSIWVGCSARNLACKFLPGVNSGMITVRRSAFALNQALV